MLALKRLMGNLGGIAVMVHRLGGRHIGTGPFKTKWEGFQIEDQIDFLRYSDLNQKNSEIERIPRRQKKKLAIRKQNSAVEDKRAVSASLGAIF